MRAVGFECGKSGFAFVILDRVDEVVTLAAEGHRPVPANSTRQNALAWIYDEVRDMSGEFKLEVARIKRAEIAMSMSNSILEHAEVDGVVQASLASSGIPCETIPWKTMAAHLGFPKKDAAIANLKTRTQFDKVARSRMGALGAALVAIEA